MQLQGLDERITQKLTQEHSLKIKESLIGLPQEVLLLVFIIFSALSGFIIGYNWYRIFKAKDKWIE